MAQAQAPQAGRKERALWSQIYVLTPPWPWASVSLPWTSVLSCGRTSSNVYQVPTAGLRLEQVHNTLQLLLLTISEGYGKMNLEMSWEPWGSGSLNKRQVAPLKGPWSSGRGLTTRSSRIKSPHAFAYSCVQINIYGGPAECRDYARHEGTTTLASWVII